MELVSFSPAYFSRKMIRIATGLLDKYRKLKYETVSNTLHLITKLPIVPKPISLIFTITTRCDLKCHICFRKLGCKVQDMGINVLRKITSFAYTPWSYIVGAGEPLLHPNFLEIIKYMKLSGMDVAFTTNGMALTENLAKKLCILGVDFIQFSIDAVTPTLYERIKRGAKFDRLISNIKAMTRIKKQLNVDKPVLGINFVAMKDNIAELPKIVKLAVKLGIERIHVANINAPTKELSMQHLHAIPNVASRFIQESKKIAERHGITLTHRPLAPTPACCIDPWLYPYIAPNGDVYPCTFIGNFECIAPSIILWYQLRSVEVNIHSFKLGNVLEESFDKIWNNHKIRMLRRHLQGIMNESLKKELTTRNYQKLLLTAPSRPLGIGEFCKFCPYNYNVCQ